MDTNEMEIIPFNDGLSSFFTELNLTWLRRYFVVEPIDEEMLSKPRQYIIEKGGYIFFARLHDVIIGTFALIRHEENVFELSKMAVSENFQGMKTGSRMLEFCLDYARQLNVHTLVLYSNTILEPAIHLYKKFGFKEVPVGNSQYKRSNIKMEIAINQKI